MDKPAFSTIRSSLIGTVVMVCSIGDEVTERSVVAVIESMKMEHPVLAMSSGTIQSVMVELGEAVRDGSILVELKVGATRTEAAPDSVTSTSPRLGELRDRVALLQDAARPEAVEKRRARGLRTARENLDDLLDPGSYVEYGRFAYAAQRARRSEEELIARTPADGLISGIGTVGGRPTAAISYDATVLAGTQGQRNHAKKDRLLDLVARQQLPLVFFTEGGGGRPGDTDFPVV
ncbi:MAG: carboxyl transferase domain-containing protein, partial [Actinomycetota bacterium]